MRYAWLYSSALVLCIFFVRPVSASVVINEVFFDPFGSDSGLEKIELYNNSNVSVSLSGWQLYPDGIGYFTFPLNFSFAARSFIVAHLRATGADDAVNLYHSTPTANMGNSSGSVALFTGEPRGKETIVDFVRYHKQGSSEKKTWESAAVAAGLWSAGEFVDIAGLQEGGSLALANDGMRESTLSWRIISSPTIGVLNIGRWNGVVVQDSADEESEHAVVLPLPPQQQEEVSVSLPSSTDSASAISSLSLEGPSASSIQSSEPFSSAGPLPSAPSIPQPSVPVQSPMGASSVAVLPTQPVQVLSKPDAKLASHVRKLLPVVEDNAGPEGNEREANGKEPKVVASKSDGKTAAMRILSPPVLFFAASTALGILAAIGFLLFRLR